MLADSDIYVYLVPVALGCYISMTRRRVSMLLDQFTASG